MSILINLFNNLNLFKLCEKYHYFFFVFGMLIESDMFLVTSGYFGGIKHMNIYVLLLGGFFLTVFFNQIVFLIGKKYKNNINDYIANNKDGFFTSKISKFYEYFNKYKNNLALIFRFLFTIRLIAPFILGTTEMTNRQFFISNILGGAVWSVLMIGGGFLLSKYYSYETASKIFHYMPFVGIFILIILFLKSYIQNN
jgi:membrane-associated protein